MSGTDIPIIIAAHVDHGVDHGEAAGVTIAAALCAEALTAVAGRPHVVFARFDDAPGADVHLLSLLPALADPAEPLADIERRWTDRIGTLAATGAPVVLANIFRHVSNRRDAGAALLTRIRELNLLAIGLSQRLGVPLADVDRVLSYLGARPIGCDYRQQGARAADAAGYAIAIALLRSALDHRVDPALLEAAERHIGDLAAQPVRLSALDRERQAARG